MEEKKRLIMETALSLFAEKGYHETSIQEIAERIGIAKGSVYSFFRSKEEILFTIFDHYHQMMYELARDTLADNLPARQKLSKLIHISLEQFGRFKLFLTLQRKEAHLYKKREIRDMVFDFRAKRFFTFRQVVAEVYGQEAEPYWMDLATIISGMTIEFMSYATFDRKNVDFDRVCTFIVNTLDATAESLVRKQSEPVLTMALMNDFMRSGHVSMSTSQQQLLDQVWALKEVVMSAPFDLKQCEEAEQAYTALETEILRGGSKTVNARAMALFLCSMPDARIEQAAREILVMLESTCSTEGEERTCKRG